MRPEGDVPRGFPPGFVRSGKDHDALLAMAAIPGTVPRRVHALAWMEGRAGRLPAAVERGALGAAAARRLAEVDLTALREKLTGCGARMAHPGHPDYPERLLDLPDPPAWLFLRGGRVPDAPAVAVVGARRCSSYGRELAHALGRGLSAGGVPVVSGAALGVDGAAHRGALSVKSGGAPTVAVLGSGIDRAHPGSNRRLIAAIAERGVIVSEYPPGAPPARFRFPARNRLVAALASHVVVVEGAPGSGSIITVDHATDMGREVLAVPGPVTSPLSDVPHRLIRDGAALIRGAADVLASLGLDAGSPSVDLDRLTAEERVVLEAVAGTGVTADAVAGAAGLPAGRALAALAGLELRGLVRATGGRYRRTTDPGAADDPGG